jgi:hypothetical protein
VTIVGFDLWSEASRDHDAEAAGRRFVAGKVATHDFWPFLAGAETREEYTNRLALVADQIDQALASSLPEDADFETFAQLRTEVVASLAEDWLTGRRANLIESMRKGAPFADYSDFQDCTSKNSDKDDPEAYCGRIKHQTEDSKTSKRIAALFVLSEKDQAAFNEEMAKLAYGLHPFGPDGWKCPDPTCNFRADTESDALKHLSQTGHRPRPDAASKSAAPVMVHPPHRLTDERPGLGVGHIPDGGAIEHERHNDDLVYDDIAGANAATLPHPTEKPPEESHPSFFDRMKHVLTGSEHTAGEVPPQFLEQQKKKSDDEGDDKDSDSKGSVPEEFKEQQDGVNGDSKNDPDNDNKAEDGSSNSAQKDDDSDDKKSGGPPPWVKNKESSKTAAPMSQEEASKLTTDWLSKGIRTPTADELRRLREFLDAKGIQPEAALRFLADNEAPYRLKESGGGWDVVNSNGDVKGHHGTRDEALAQQRALYANVPGAREKAEADEKKSSLSSLLAKSASLVTALGEQFTSDNPFSSGAPSSANSGGSTPSAPPQTSGPEARPWQDMGSGMAAPQTGMGANPVVLDPTTQDPNMLTPPVQTADTSQSTTSKLASVDRVTRITAGILATNPGIDPAAARQVAEETVQRYPGSAPKD